MYFPTLEVVLIQGYGQKGLLLADLPRTQHFHGGKSLHVANGKLPLMPGPSRRIQNKILLTDRDRLF